MPPLHPTTRKPLRRIARRVYAALALLVTLALLLVNLRLYLPPSAAYGTDRIGPDVLPQLRFIKASLVAGAGEQMQSVFPEGFFFTHVLYGLAWVEIGLRQPDDAPLHQQALAEARWALARLDTPAGRAPFAARLDPPYGVFYAGWSTWLRGGVLKLQPPAQRDAREIARFEIECAALAAAFDRSATPFLAAYPGQAWPVDSTVAVAALRLHDNLLQPRFTSTIDRWLAAAQQRLDPATGLLPHRADFRTGRMLEGARGSSQSIIARFLIEIDPALGRAQYRQFRTKFVATPFSVPGVREYPQGIDGAGDVDSGPLIFGLSASATAVMLGAAQLHNDRAFADPVRHVAEATGMPLSWGSSKRYLFGALPVADAFVVWAKTARPWIAQPAPEAWPAVVPWWWRWPFHALTLAPAALLWLPFARKPRRT